MVIIMVATEVITRVEVEAMVETVMTMDMVSFKAPFTLKYLLVVWLSLLHCIVRQL